MSPTNFVHFKCRNTKKLDLVAEKVSQLESCRITKLGSTKLFITFLKNPLAVFFDSSPKKSIEYYRNNLMKTVIRLPFVFSLFPLRFIYELTFKIKTRLTYRYLESFFKTEKFDAVLIWGGSYLPQTVLIELCQKYNKKTLFFEVSSLPKKIQVDPEGVNYRASLSRDPNFYKTIDFNNSESVPDEIGFRASKIKSNDRTSDLPNNFIFVPFQVPSDSQILDFSPWIKSMEHFYEILLKIAKERPDLQFVIKEHPSFKLKIVNKVEDIKNITFSNFGETKELIEKSDAVMTINSSVGLEGLILSKKVIVLGLANFALENLVLIANDDTELLRVLDELGEWSYDEELRVSFLKYFYNRFLIDGNYDDLSDSTVKAALNKVLT